MDTFIDTFKNLGAARLGIMAGVAAAILAFFIYFTDRVSQPGMELLYNQLETSDSSQIVTYLEQQGIPYELSSDGSRIMVPENQVARVRLAVAEQGLPSGGSLGYEIFDRSEGLGTSNFVQNINHLRALEGELARTIRSLSNVQSARVHLVLSQRELFSRQRNRPTASIVVTLVGQRRLQKQQIVAIQQLIAAAVPELAPESVAIIDDKGNLLARTRDADDPEETASTADEMRIALENRLAATIEELLEQSVGNGKVRAEVSAELDFDRVTENSEIYDPDGQVVRSTQVVEENSQDTDGGDQPVTVGNNLPDANIGNLDPGSSSQSNRTEETVNYEISRIVKTHVRESGIIRRLSVAVLVDGTYSSGEDGELTYEPRSAEELEQLAALARSAVGYDDQRGDSLEIVNLRFADLSQNLEQTYADSGFLGINKNELLRIAELVVLGIVAALVLLLVVKPLITRLLERQGMGAEGGMFGGMALQAPDGGGSTAGLLKAPGSDTAYAEQTGIMAPDDEDGGGEALIDLNKVEGRVRASSLRKISEIIEKHPEEATAIVKSWLYQDA